MWIYCIISCFTRLWKAINNTSGMVWLTKAFPWGNFHMLKANSDSWQQKELNLLKSSSQQAQLSYSTKWRLNLASQINNSASCIRTALIPNSHFFDLAWQIHEEEKAKFCIYLTVCQMEYRLNTTSAVPANVRETLTKIMGRITHLCVLSFGLSAAYQASLLTRKSLAFFFPSFSPFFCAETPTLHTSDICFLHLSMGFVHVEVLQAVWHCRRSSKQWNNVCHQVGVSGCVQTQEGWVGIVYMVLLAPGCLLCS